MSSPVNQAAAQLIFGTLASKLDVESTQANVSTVEKSVVTVVDAINSMSAQPFWVSPNPFEDVSFPVNDLKPVTVPAANTGVSNGGDGDGSIPSSGNHSHTIGTVTQQPLMTAATGRLYLVPIQTAQDRMYSTLGFVTNGTAAMTSFHTGIYQFDRTTGNANLVYSFGNVKGNLLTGSGIFHQRMITSYDLGALKGDCYYVGLLSIGGTQPQLGAIPSVVATRADSLHPKAQTLYIDGQSSLPSTISGSSVQSNLGYQVWTCLGQPTEAYDPAAQFSYTETFERPDSTNYGASYITRGTAQGIRSGEATSTAVLSYGQAGSLRISPTNTDKQRVGITLGDYRVADSQTGVRAILRARSDYSTYACFRVHPDTLSIRSGAGFGNETVRASIQNPGIPTSGEEYVLEVDGNVFTAYYPGGNFSWTDSGGIVPTGTQCRYVGWGLDNTLLYGYSASIESWYGRDWL
ncbi:hypothetical protein CJ179_38285 [Rhodococcus sp. ACS1]|uniref:DUF7257 domain-containing protein n=1 Tax=Rhodococcus sp. ACS1 TaxID=2028570 RepID=UPI000BB11B46|nr:hypothetical protein [Rhodococcus sp. ACS1]PBC38457.1 hypothetical protein CJ179_38285 [Rhodococcus sp. ACS1]